MTESEAVKEIQKMAREYAVIQDQIAKKAMQEGRWNPGLDSNRHIFDAINKEIKQKIDEIIAKIDE